MKTVIREIRLREFVPLGITGQVVTSRDVDMVFDDAIGAVYAKRRRTAEEFIVPLATISYLRPETLEPTEAKKTLKDKLSGL